MKQDSAGKHLHIWFRKKDVKLLHWEIKEVWLEEQKAVGSTCSFWNLACGLQV